MSGQEHIVYLSLGSNLGDKLRNLMDAVALLSNFEQTELIGQSKIYRTSAWGKTDQPDFLNMAISIRTFIEPKKLMRLILKTEEQLGRIRQEHWGPRKIDIDILFYGQFILNEKELIIPHSEMQNRKFVLIPLNDIAAEMQHPLLMKTISELLKICPDILHVEEVHTPV